MADPHADTANNPSVFSLVIRSKSSLYAAWIPLLKGGGLFLPSNKEHKLGDEVIVLLSLLDESTKVPIAGHVSWINPPHAAGNRPQGIGIALADTEAGRELKKKIEGLLAGALQSSRPTNTI